MDIMRPSLGQQVAPAPWLVARSNVDVPGLIWQMLAQQPDATVDDIVQRLSGWGVQASGIIVSMWVMRFREPAADTKTDEGTQSSEAMRETESYCTCDELQSCTCGKPRPPTWWRRYRSGVRVTPAQAEAVEEFLERDKTP